MLANQNIFDLQTLVQKVIRLSLFFVILKKISSLCNLAVYRYLVRNYDNVTGRYSTYLQFLGS